MRVYQSCALKSVSICFLRVRDTDIFCLGEIGFLCRHKTVNFPLPLAGAVAAVASFDCKPITGPQSGYAQCSAKAV